MSIEQLDRSDVLEAWLAVYKQARRLETKVVVRSDVRIDHEWSITR